MRSHIVDSRFHGHLYSTDVSREIFSDEARLQRWLDVEAALARSQADVGLIPSGAADAICYSAHIGNLDLGRIEAETLRTGHTLMGLLNVLRDACANDFGQYVHYGITTQDIQDTGQVLEMRIVANEVTAGLERLIATSKDIAHLHRKQVQVGRTHAQPALPISFGLKVASWIDEMCRHRTRIDEWTKRALVVQMFGACGTMSAMGPRAFEVLKLTAHHLGLTVPAMSWHSSRDRVVEFVFILSLVAGTLARLADEVRTLSRPEIGELQLPWEEDAIASSTLPQKRNPDACEQVVVLARLAKGLLGPALDVLVQDHERDFRGTRLEWVTVVDSSHYTLKCVELTRQILASIRVDGIAMTENAYKQRHLICMESVAFRLAAWLGKDTAMTVVRDACRRAHACNTPVTRVLAEDPRVNAMLTQDDLDAFLVPENGLGHADELIERVLALARSVSQAPSGHAE